jgi:hypothetical protein
MAVYTVQFMPSMKQVPRIENEFERLMNVFQETGSPIFFSDLKDAVRHIGQSIRSAFLILEDRFEAPQFGSGQAVLDDGVLILRKGFGAYSERIRSAFRRQADRDSDLMPIAIPT